MLLDAGLGRSTVSAAVPNSTKWSLLKDCSPQNCEAYAKELSGWLGTELQRTGEYAPPVDTARDSDAPQGVAGETIPRPPAAPIILGALAKAEIDAVVKAQLSQIRECYLPALRSDPAIGGLVITKFIISKDGTVTDAHTLRSTLNREDVERCLSERFLELRFPEPDGGGIVLVSYPFIFTPH